ncbi:MAG: NAD-dependent epimerase/dehydratase family protein [Anaerolineae bacterium]|nr:NAD-dependent epimerase/dehydratase family protein [Anaerolineae bacterium]
MTESALVLVTGATGAVGPALVAELRRQGQRVRVLSRQRPLDPLFPPDVEFHSGDISDRDAVRTALTGVQQVYHIAALLHVTNPPPELRADYQRVNVAATRIVAEEAARAGAQRLIYFSTVKVYGTHSAQPVTEDHPLNPQTDYAQSKLDGERAAHKVIDTSVLRLSPIYSARLRGSWRFLVRGIQRGVFVPVGGLQNVRSLTHVDDAARAAVLVAAQPASATVNLVAHDAVPMHSVLDAIYAACGKSRPAVHLPAALVETGAGFAEVVFRLVGKRSPLTRESIAQLTQSETYSGARLRALGFTPQITLEEGWRRTVAELGQ